MGHILKKNLIYLPMMGATLLWAGAYIGGKFGVDEFTPQLLLTLRFLVATLFVFGLMALRRAGEWKIRTHDILVLAILGLTGAFANNLFFFLALAHTSVTNASILFATTPFMTAILASIFLSEPLGLKRLCALAIALAGVILLITGGNLDVLLTMDFNIGDIYEVGAAFSLAIFAILSKKVANNYSPITMIGYESLFALAASIPVLFISHSLPLATAPSWRGWISLLYLGIMASAVAYILQQISIKNIGASKSTAFLNLTPLLAVILGMILLGEKLSFVDIASGILILTGVFLNSKAGRASLHPWSPRKSAKSTALANRNALR